jgi:hypothetical protein
MTTQKGTPEPGIEVLKESEIQLEAWQAWFAMVEIGRHLQTVERQIRPQLLIQIENAGKRCIATQELEQAGRLIEIMCAAWRGEIDTPNLWNVKEMRRRRGE